MAGTGQNETVVGVFDDEGTAQNAISALQSAGYQAQIADRSAIRAFRDSGFEDEIVKMYESRAGEGDSVVMANGPASGGAMRTLLDQGAQFVNISGGQGYAGQQQAQAGYGQQQGAYYQGQQAGYDQQAAYSQQAGYTTGQAGTQGEQRVQLREEQLVPTKQAVEAGQVELRKTVEEQEQEVPVNLTREEAYVERRPVDRPADAGEIRDMQDEVIRVPVYEEQAQLQKQGRVAEEVVVGKQPVQEQQTLSGTVRREDVEVVNRGDVNVRGDVQDADVRDEDRDYTQG